MALSDKEIKNRFGTHKPDSNGEYETSRMHDDLREIFGVTSSAIDGIMAPGNPRYATLAQTALEESAMWAHKAVAAIDWPNQPALFDEAPNAHRE